MAETKITDDHFYFWIEYYNKKWEVTCTTDVNEEIDVYKDHIRYENYCPWVREDYYDFAYKLEWDKLMIKCINYNYVHFWERHKATDYPFIKDWIYNEKEMKKYFIWEESREDKRYYAQLKFERRNYVKWLLEWHEWKEPRKRTCHQTKMARDRVIKQIKNKNFKDK